MSYQLPPSGERSGPIGEGNYTVQEGDCVESLALRTGHTWETIWNHSQNASLKQSRASHNILLPGDQLYIPPIELKSVSRSVDAKHEFKRKGTPSKLRLRVLEAGQPQANQPYRLIVDGQQFTGSTDGDGWIEVAIPPDAQEGLLSVGNHPLAQPRRLKLGGIDPITEVSGIQKRLRNLGFPCPESGELDEPTRAAVAMFQKGEEAEATGEPDRDTLEKLKQRYGS